MVHAKNYETTSKFVKVMPRIRWPLFSRTRCIRQCYVNCVFLHSPTHLHVALVDVLRTLSIEPDGIVGHSIGELGSAYADGSLTAEETILCAYWRGRCVSEANLPAGGMAAIGE